MQRATAWISVTHTAVAKPSPFATFGVDSSFHIAAQPDRLHKRTVQHHAAE
jgi:hypothetical protein